MCLGLRVESDMVCSNLLELAKADALGSMQSRRRRDPRLDCCAMKHKLLVSALFSLLDAGTGWID